MSTFDLTLTLNHETGPPDPEFENTLRNFLSKMGTVHVFTVRSRGERYSYEVELCTSLDRTSLEEVVRRTSGLLTKVEERGEACHDCPKMVA